MGYRLDIEVYDDKENITETHIASTKLYGYTGYDDIPKSAEFLVEKGYYYDVRPLISAWVYPEIKISVKDFKIFAELYNKELNEQWGKYDPIDWWIKQEDIQKIFNLPDNYKVLLLWG